MGGCSRPTLLMRMAQLSGSRQQGQSVDEGQRTRRWPQPSLLGELEEKRSRQAGMKRENLTASNEERLSVTTAAQLDYFKG